MRESTGGKRNMNLDFSVILNVVRINNNVSNLIKQIRKFFFENRKNLFTCVISVFMFGIVAHGPIIFSKIALHDEIISLYDVHPSWLLMLGRWGAYCFQRCLNFYYGYKVFSIPCYYVFFSFLFLSIILFLVVNLFNLKEKSFVILSAGLIVLNPTILMLFGYIHGAQIFILGYFLCCFGSYVLCKYEKKITCFLLSFICFVLSIGLYQANLSLICTLILLSFIKKINSNEFDLKKLLIDILYVFCNLLLVMIVYFAILKFFLYLTSLKLVSYSGVSNMGITSFSGYVSRIKSAYKIFLTQELSRYSTYIMFPARTRLFYKCILIIFSFSIIYNCYMIFKGSRKAIIPIYLFFVLLIPFAVNLLFILSPEDGSHHSLHVFSHIIFIIFVMSHISDMSYFVLKKSLRYCCLFLLMILNLSYVRYDNTCYQRIILVQSKCISYFTTLITQIKSVEGYKIDMPVTYINEFKKKSSTLPLSEEEHFNNDIIVTLPYCYDIENSINDYAWKEFMSVWCGFETNIENSEKYESLPEVLSMPHYPDFGSIKIINDVIVVKF